MKLIAAASCSRVVGLSLGSIDVAGSFGQISA
jgi:hypothetical protein